MHRAPTDYQQVLEDLKRRVHEAHARAAVNVNRELVGLYLAIGRRLAEQQSCAGWGDKAVERLARDLRAAFPAMRGFSRTNVFLMRQVYLAWADAAPIVQQLVGQIPWGHHLLLLARVRDPGHRAWYLQRTVTHGWSRAMLGLHIERRLHARQGRALTNFAQTLSPPQSDLAQGALKDPYVFDFLTLEEGTRERELEAGLLAHIEKFLLELGVGFALVGRQVPLEVGAEEYAIDLLFYHLELRCYVVIEFKVVPFRPEFAGKMNFYLSAVDERFRRPEDRPSIGLLLCRAKERLVVEYALRDMRRPIGVAAWGTRLVEALPRNLRGRLPAVREIEAELAGPTRHGHGRGLSRAPGRCRRGRARPSSS